MAGYKWRDGKPKEDPTPTPTPPKPPRPRKPRSNAAACGTYSGYKTHKINCEEACQDCKTAMRAYCKEYRARVKRGEITPNTTFIPGRCGTRAGYTQHRKHKEDACQPCRAALAQYHRDWRAGRT